MWLQHRGHGRKRSQVGRETDAALCTVCTECGLYLEGSGEPLEGAKGPDSSAPNAFLTKRVRPTLYAVSFPQGKALIFKSLFYAGSGRSSMHVDWMNGGMGGGCGYRWRH